MVENWEEKLKEEGWYFVLVRGGRKWRFREEWHFRSPGSPSQFFLYGPEGKPAVTEFTSSSESGVVTLEEWRLNILDRNDGPASIRRDPETGVVIQEDWYRRGTHFRTNGPAVIKYDRITGVTIFDAYYDNRRKICERYYPNSNLNPISSASPSKFISARPQASRRIANLG